jgi:hypothetical protein
VTRLKQVLGVLGLLAALAGIALNNRPIIWVAIGLLGASILLRAVIGARERRAEGEEEAGSDRM